MKKGFSLIPASASAAVDWSVLDQPLPALTP